MKESKYYSSRQVLSYGTPFVFTLGNRSIGKTFDYTSLCINKFLKRERRFIYMRRHDSDLQLVVPTFFDNVRQKYKNVALEVNGSGKSGTTFLINNKIAGMCISLSLAYKYKSVNLSDYDIIFFDEFLPEDGQYLKDEVAKSLNFYNSVARGFDQPIRPDVRFIFVANNVTLNNPYFRELHIRERINLGTRYCVDEDRAWVVEMTNNQAIADEIAKTPFGKMISKTKYGDYALKSAFYLDNDTFLEKPTGNSDYFCTLYHMGKGYGVYEYTDIGLYFITKKYNKTFPLSFSLTTDDHKPNLLMIYKNRAHPVFTMLKFAFDNALLRFDCDESKLMFLDYMSYANMR